MLEQRTAIVTEESQSTRRAVIEVRRNEVYSERFANAYRDEEPLRELIAAPSVIGIGSTSREAAAAVIPNSSSRDADSKNIPRQCLRHRVRLTETRRIARAALQNAVAAGILMFYSRSALGTVIRAFVGA